MFWKVTFICFVSLLTKNYDCNCTYIVTVHL
jgi:hypothetical protein